MLQKILPDLAFIGLALGLLVESRGIKNPGFDLLGPAFLPQAILVGIIMVSAISILTQYLENRGGLPDELARPSEPTSDCSSGEAAQASIAKVLILFGMLLVFVWSIYNQITKFELSGALFLFASMTFLSGLGWGVLIRNGIVAIVLPLVLGMLFRNYLYINLP